MKFDLDLVGEDKPQSIEIRNGVLIHENAPAEKGKTRVVTVDRNSFIDAIHGRHVSGGLSGDDATFLEQLEACLRRPHRLSACGSRISIDAEHRFRNPVIAEYDRLLRPRQVLWSWSSCSAEYGLPPESKSFAAAQYSMKSLTICLNSSAEEGLARMQPCTRRLD